MSISLKTTGEIIILVVATAFLVSCAGVDYFPSGNVQTGIASWYGPDFHGKSTSSREIYDMHDMTAAHRTLPFDTHVMVTNLSNGRSVIVRINDRGPFVKDRVIDLSYAAARIIGMIGPGTAPVRIEVLRNLSPPRSRQIFSVQVGSFVHKENARALQRKLRNKYRGVSVVPFETPGRKYFRVRIKARTEKEARRIADRLAADGYTVIIFEE